MYKDTDPQETKEWLESIEDALSELRIIGADIEAAGRTPGDAFTSIPEE